MWIINEKAPRRKPPHPPPHMRVTHPQQRWNTHGEQQSWFKILPPDGAQEESILANNIQHNNKKENAWKKKNYSSTSQKNAPTHIHANSVIYDKIQHHTNQAAKRWNLAQHKLQKETANDRKQIYEANHLYLMIAFISEKVQENYHLQISFLVKTTSHLKKAGKVPFFAARWCSLCKFRMQSKSKQPEKTMRNTTV